MLGFCLLHFMKGTLPWIRDDVNDKDVIFNIKHSFIESLPDSMLEYFPECPKELIDYFLVINEISKDITPNYEGLRNIFKVTSFIFFSK